MEDFKDVLSTKGGFISAHWDGTTESELKMKELTKATIRCIPNDNPQEPGKDLITGNVFHSKSVIRQSILRFVARHAYYD